MIARAHRQVRADGEREHRGPGGCAAGQSRRGACARAGATAEEAPPPPMEPPTAAVEVAQTAPEIAVEEVAQAAESGTPTTAVETPQLTAAAAVVEDVAATEELLAPIAALEIEQPVPVPAAAEPVADAPAEPLPPEIELAVETPEVTEAVRFEPAPAQPLEAPAEIEPRVEEPAEDASLNRPRKRLPSANSAAWRRAANDRNGFRRFPFGRGANCAWSFRISDFSRLPRARCRVDRRRRLAQRSAARRPLVAGARIAWRRRRIAPDPARSDPARARLAKRTRPHFDGGRVARHGDGAGQGRAHPRRGEGRRCAALSLIRHRRRLAAPAAV